MRMANKNALAQLGCCYYPEQWPQNMWKNDAKRMVELGLSIVRIGEFAWSRIEPMPDSLDWQWLDEAMDTLGASFVDFYILRGRSYKAIIFAKYAKKLLNYVTSRNCPYHWFR